MATNTKLLVLGVVRIHQPVHGYDVRQELLRWRVHEWGKVHPGSIYHQLNRLTRDGFLEVTDVERRGSRPARTCYRLTDQGATEFTALLRHQLWTIGHHAEDILVGLCFLPFVTREEAIAAMEARESQLRAIETGMRYNTSSSPEHVAEIVHLGSARALADAQWAAELAERLRGGAYVMAGEPGGPARPGQPDVPDHPDSTERPDRTARPDAAERPEAPDDDQELI